MNNLKRFLIKFFFHTPRIIFINFYRMILRKRIFHLQRLPVDRPAILAVNHVTGADPIILLASIRKKIIFLADNKCFETRITDFFFRTMANSMPVFKQQFSRNIKTFKELFNIFKSPKNRNGNVFLGIFPEGRLNKNISLSEFFKGTAYLSYKMKLPIIPVYMSNLFKGPIKKEWFLKRPVLEGLVTIFINAFKRIHIFIGEPIEPLAENIFYDMKSIADRNRYKNTIDKINTALASEFEKLESEAKSIVAKLTSEKSSYISADESEDEDDVFKVNDLASDSE